MEQMIGGVSHEEPWGEAFQREGIASANSG